MVSQGKTGCFTPRGNGGWAGANPRWPARLPSAHPGPTLVCRGRNLFLASWNSSIPSLKALCPPQAHRRGTPSVSPLPQGAALTAAPAQRTVGRLPGDSGPSHPAHLSAGLSPPQDAWTMAGLGWGGRWGSAQGVRAPGCLFAIPESHLRPFCVPCLPALIAYEAIQGASRDPVGRRSGVP